MPSLELDNGAKKFWSLLPEVPLPVANSTASSQAGIFKADDLIGLQPSESIATAEVPRTTGVMPSTTVGLPIARMQSTTAGMPSTTAETPSTIVASDSAHQASVPAEFSTDRPQQHMHQQQQQQQERKHSNVNCMSHNQQACLPSDRSDGSPSSVTSSTAFNCERKFAHTDTVDLWGGNNATAEGGASAAQSGSPFAHSTASTAQTALPTTASSAVTNQGDAAAAQAGHTERRLDPSLAQCMISSAWLEHDVEHFETNSEEEESAPEQAAALAASSVRENPKAATAEHSIATAEALPATAEALPAIAEAVPATAVA